MGRSPQLGRELLERALRKARMAPAKTLEGEVLAEVARRQGRGSVNALLAAIGYGRVNAQDIVRLLRGDPEQAALETAFFVCSSN